MGSTRYLKPFQRLVAVLPACLKLEATRLERKCKLFRRLHSSP
jgi:hypothetical protein